MTRSGRPWATIIVVVVCALIAAAALLMAAKVRQDRVASAGAAETTAPSTTTSGPGADGCLTDPCRVQGPIPIGGTTVQLVADAGGKSGRMQIGGAGASDVIEVTITKLGAVLGADALQCVGGTLSACVVRGKATEGVLGQVIVGRSAKWASLEKPFASDAGFIAVQDVTGQQSGPEVLVAQYRCDRTTAAECADSPVYVQIFSTRSEVLGCTRDYARLDSMPGWPNPDLTDAAINPCD